MTSEWADGPTFEQALRQAVSRRAAGDHLIFLDTAGFGSVAAAESAFETEEEIILRVNRAELDLLATVLDNPRSWEGFVTLLLRRARGGRVS